MIIDSPMAVDATEIHRRWLDELVDETTRRRLAAGGRLITLPDVRPIRDAEQSRELNDMEGPMVIISTSGMCTGGRILHHLRHNLGRPSTHVVIVGYQGEGTLGRRLVEGARRVEIFGDPIEIRASIHTLNGLSAHAGKGELLGWAEGLCDDRPMVFVNHGEEGPRRALAAALRAAGTREPFLPQWTQEFVA
ncbi:MAG: MBL fold metallo-hydrolase RNA specificity domain-containing protein [Phycisphaerales bacterium]